MSDTRLLAASPAELLRQDHDRIRQMFADYDRTAPDLEEARQHLFEEIRLEMLVHGKIEREYFYPALETDRPAIQEDHVALEGLLEKLSEMKVGDKSFDALMKLLEENFTLHAAAEERELFSQLERLAPLPRQELTLKLESARVHSGRARLG
ncbi:MAG TPA: hemerythrin domain-containing protein [Planctomycetota bacterium]|nr:hemerythrin domain-containing protein [Planctomycetota bacterium]